MLDHLSQKEIENILKTANRFDAAILHYVVDIRSAWPYVKDDNFLTTLCNPEDLPGVLTSFCTLSVSVSAANLEAINNLICLYTTRSSLNIDSFCLAAFRAAFSEFIITDFAGLSFSEDILACYVRAVDRFSGGKTARFLHGALYKGFNAFSVKKESLSYVTQP